MADPCMSRAGDGARQRGPQPGFLARMVAGDDLGMAARPKGGRSHGELSGKALTSKVARLGRSGRWQEVLQLATKALSSNSAAHSDLPYFSIRTTWSGAIRSQTIKP